MSDLSLIFNNLFRKKLRTILLLFSIFSAFWIYGVLGSFNVMFESGGDVAALAHNRLITVNKVNFTVSMPEAYVNRIRAVKGVKYAAGAMWFGGYYQDPKVVVQTFGVQIDQYLDTYPDIVMPEAQREAFLKTRDCLAVGEALANARGWKLGQTVPINSNIWRKKDGSGVWDFKVCAIFKGDKPTVATTYAIFHYKYFNESLAYGGDSFHWIVVVPEQASMNDRIIAQIDKMFANSPAETKTSTEVAFNQSFFKQVGNLALIITSVSGAAFATILMIVGTTMIMAVAERTKEIAVMKTLGFQTGRIFRLVLSESLFLSFLGGALGLLAAWGTIIGVAAMLAGFLPGLKFVPQVAVMALGLMLALGLATGLFPAWRAMNVKIVDALSKH